MVYSIIKILDKDYVLYENGELFNIEEKRFLKPHQAENGYLGYCMCNNGEKNYKSIHRLIAETFIPNPDNKPEIDHINGNRQDNRLKNLRWCTHKENMSNPITHERLNATKKKPIVGMDKNGNEVCRFDSVSNAVDAGYSIHCGEVANGKRIRSNKLYWKWL